MTAASPVASPDQRILRRHTLNGITDQSLPPSGAIGKIDRALEKRVVD
jgi:hypothetical protein